MPSSRSASRPGRASKDPFRFMTDHDHYPDALLVKVLRGVKTIAMVGASPDWNRPSAFAIMASKRVRSSLLSCVNAANTDSTALAPLLCAISSPWG